MGLGGGRIAAHGSPDRIMKNKISETGRALQKLLRSTL